VTQGSDAIQTQIYQCLRAVSKLNRCIQNRDWERLNRSNQSLEGEMDSLKSTLASFAILDDETVSQLQQLEIKVRRTQRQLVSQAAVVESDIESLEQGLRKVASIKQALES